MARLVMADITERVTGRTVGVPVSARDARLLRTFPYWRAFFFRLGQGIPQELMREEALKLAGPGDYGLRLMRQGGVIYDG